MRLGIYTNRLKDETLEIAKNIGKYAEEEGIDYVLLEEHTEVEKNEELIKSVDIVLIVGGDGTVLNLCDQVARLDKPILSVNNGRMGFLTEIELFEVPEALHKIKQGNFRIEERMMVEMEAYGKKYSALNEILVVRDKRNGISTIDIKCDGVYIDTYEGDGIILSTPTGSTGYSLSSGGPILSPNINALLLTPLCVHSLHNRPIVLNENEVVELEIDSRDDKNVAYVDGKEIGVKIKPGSKITIKKSDLTVKFVRITSQSFYKRMYNKLVQWNNLTKE